MNKKYLVTGFDKKRQKMATHVYSSIEDVVDLINMCEAGTSSLAEIEDEQIIKYPKDLDFDVQTQTRIGSAKIVDTPKFCWSICNIK